MCSEGFSITRSDHAWNVVGVFGRYLDEETLVDCTIAAEGEYLKAHRIVLSACSTYFELVFGQEMKKEKVVVLEDIKFKNLKLLIALMYEGQVTLPKDELRDFVRAAEFLQIRGLPVDLVQNSPREATEMSVECTKEGLALQLSHKHQRCSANSGESSHPQWVTSIIRNQTGDQRHSTNKQKNLSQENVPLQHLSFLDRETTVFPAEKEPSVEPKEEVDTEDTPIWGSEDEYTCAVTDLSSATTGEGIQNEVTPVPNTISSSFVSSTQILENESVTSIAKLSFVTGTIPFSTSTASSTPLVPNVPTEQSDCAKEDSFSGVRTELAEQSICVKSEPVAKTEVIPRVVSLHSESVEEPMLHVWVGELQSYESEEVIAGTDSSDTWNQETTIQDLDAAGASDNNQSAVRPNDIFKDFPSHMVVQKNEKDINAKEVKEETEVDKWCMGHDCKSIDVIGSIVDKVVKSRQQSTRQMHNDNLLYDEHEMKGEEMMVETLERALGADDAVEQSDAEEEDSAPLLERFSKMMGKKSHRCLRCPGVFCTVSELRMHVKNAHKKIHSKRCELCLATFPFKSYLMRHMRRHGDERPLKCGVCEKSFNQSGNLTNHKRIHADEHPFQCNFCKRSFNGKCRLTKHIRTHTGERPFQCNVCKRAFNDKSYLTTHMYTHTGERPFLCSVCGKAFIQKIQLTNHKRTHTGERPFQCNVCKKAFQVKNTLTIHMRTHTGERPFQCDVCKRAFNRKIHITTHMRTHTGERPFQCDVCKRAFSDKSTLTTHVRTHTGERPFQCNVCKRSFSRKRDLVRHMRKHTGYCPSWSGE